MKKISYLLLIVLVSLFIPNVNAKDEVSIESINLVDKSEQTTELSNPTKSGLKIGFDLSFSSLGDYAKYEVVINNDSNKEYEINDETKFSSSNYIEYKYEFKEKTNRIKANSKATLYITITYKNAVPNDKLTDGKYIENNEMAISLSNEDNPKTFNNYIYLFFILLSLIVISLLIRNMKVKSLSIIVIALLLVPTTIFALERLRIDVSTKITIEDKYVVAYLIKDVPIKESEMGNYKILKNPNGFNSCREYSMIINNEKYNRCDIDIREYHAAGERVNVNLEVDDFSWEYFDETTGGYHDLCSFENNVYTCPEESLGKKNRLFFDYSKNGNLPGENFVVFENDLEVMNFADVDTPTWTEYGTFGFSSPTSFTMPEHNVLFGWRLLN